MYSFKIYNTLLVILILFLFSCSTDKAPVEILFPKAPDSSNLVKLANFLSDDDVVQIAKSDNGMKTLHGINSVPQDGDDFRFDTLDNRYWKGVSSRNSDFRGASFRSSNCGESDFSGSDFRVSDIRWTSLFFSNLDNCDFSQSKMFHVHGTGATFYNCKFKGANMFGMEAHQAKVRDCDFSNALMKDTEFIESDFTGSTAINVRFIRAVLEHSRMDSMDLSFSDFTGAGLKKVSFINSRLHNVNFQGSHCQNADFSGADVKGANFFGTQFKNTNFKGAINIPKQIKHLIKDGVANGVLQELGK